MKQKKKLLILSVCAAVLLCMLLAFWPDQQVIQEGNLITDPDFSAVNDAGGWYQDAYVQTVGYTDYAVEDGVVTITNHALNDARFAQIVSVQPESTYCLSGWIRADASGGLGANLSIADVYVFSESVYDTQGEWQQVRLYGRTSENQHAVTIFARLGGYSGEAIGTASFKDVCLEQVSSVPDDYFTHNWYPAKPVYEKEKTDSSGAAWPYLLLIALAYALVCYFACAHMQEGQEKNTKRTGIAVIAVLAFAFVSRIAVAVLVPGYGVDVGCFTAWADMMASTGAADFYTQGVFCDYPPGYILVLGAIGTVGRWLGTGATELMIKLPSIACDVAAAAVLFAIARRYTNVRVAFVMTALYAINPLTYIAGAAWGQADSVMALCILLVVVLAMERKWYAALPVYMLAVLMKPQALMFGPLGVCALVMTLVREHDKKTVYGVISGLAGAVVVALLVVLPFGVHQEPLWIVELYRGTMGYYDSATVNACNLYFLFGRNWVGVDNATELWLRLLAMATLFGGAAYACVRSKWYLRNVWYNAAMAAVLCAALLVTVVPMTYATLGTCVIVLAVIACVALYVHGGDIRHLPLLGALLLLMLCNVGAMMHERYLFPAVLLLALACVLERDKRVYILFAAVTCTVFLNVGLVLDRGVRIGGVDGHLTAPAFGIESESTMLEYALSLVNCLLTAWSGYVAIMLCCEKKAEGFAACAAEGVEAETDAAQYNRAHDSLENYQPVSRMQRLDWLLMLGVTAVYAVVALTNLGSTTSPQTYWRSASRDEVVMLDVGEVRDMNMLYFGGIHSVDSDFKVRVSSDGENWSDVYWAQMEDGNCFQWKYLCSSYEYDESIKYTSTPLVLTGRYVEIQSNNIGTTLYEMVLRDPETKENYPVTVLSTAGAELLDEQDAFHGEPGWYNSTYFDEIYHARTGYEHYLAMQGDYSYRPYETSHPPLGKVLMAFSIGIFGMTPFGWRFAGAMAGVLMLPGMYMLGKLLTKRRIAAFAAMLLMAADCMHFTQTRIATIDSFVVLFIIWAYVFMIYYVRMDYWRTKLWKTLIPLALSGLFMGLGVASKWTGCYAGVGLAVLFFWSVWRRYVEYLHAKRVVKEYDGVQLSKKERKERALLHHEKLLRTVYAEGVVRPVATMMSCLVFFVAVPLLIYYASYIPYFLPSGGVTVQRVIEAAVGDYFRTGYVGGMLGYHGTPGLGMDHPFYSPWYEWPLIGTPMWYYSSTYHVKGTAETIVAMGNPAVWWGGLIALTGIVALWCLRHVNRTGITLHTKQNDMRPAVLLISFAAQYIPWTLVPRGTYIYHYFPAVPFIILCIVLCADYLMDTWKRWDIEHIENDVLRNALRINWSLVTFIAFLVIAVALFIAFYPYASGMTTSTTWLKMMQWFDGWIYYPAS